MDREALRAPLCALLLAAACGSSEERAPAPPTSVVTEDPSSIPIAGLPEDLVRRFEEGDARFELPFREAQGLGPLYIHRACVNCHEDDARGPGAVRRLSRVDGAAAALPYGDVVRPRTTHEATVALVPTMEGWRETLRLPPAVFARGWLEAIADDEILAAARAQTGAISGRVAQLPSGIGRFGHKARAATLEEFVADALLGDMGLTSPMRSEELPGPEGLLDDAHPGVDLSAEDIAMLSDYVRLLDVPARVADAHGAQLFAGAGCADCHVPSMHTRNDYSIAAMRDRDVSLYTDVLLHDMGDGLADGIDEGVATGREWRTAPLVGVRFLSALMHDGRVTTVSEAIAAHASAGSEANEVIARFDALPPADRDALVHFVERL